MRRIPRGPAMKVFSSPCYSGLFSSGLGTCNPWPWPLKIYLCCNIAIPTSLWLTLLYRAKLRSWKNGHWPRYSKLSCVVTNGLPVRNGDSLHMVTRNSSLANTPRLWLDRAPLVSEILLLLHFLLSDVSRRHKVRLFPSPQ